MKQLLAVALLSLVLSLGCYETKYSLVPPGSVAVDRALIGNYETTPDPNAPADEKQDKARLVVRNIDDKFYYAEWTDLSTKQGEPDKQPLRMTAFIANVNGVTFAHLRNLTDDGEVPEKHLLMRVELSADKNALKLQNLSEEFFKQQSIESDDDLKKVIDAHLNDQAMYDKGGVILTRVPIKK